MKHCRSDWDSIQPDVGETTIQEDEPVFLLRSRDVVAPSVVRYWAQLVERQGGDPELVERVFLWADQMEAWAEVNGKHVPDTPEGKLR